MPDPGERVLIAGVTTRALAGSAAKAGYQVTAIDAFGDVDLHAVADVVTLPASPRGFTPAGAAAAARAIPAGLCAYTSNFENYPEAVATLAAGRRLLGNPPAVLRAVRDPLALVRALRARRLPTPRARASAPRVPTEIAWLIKPRRSGGGRGTARWRPGDPVPRGAYLQERMGGIPGSIVFLADGRRAHPLGITRQLVGEPAFGARGFRYCGSLLGSGSVSLFEEEDRLREAAAGLAEAVTEVFGLVGLNGIDFIADAGVPWPIEVNPRPSASMELVERAGGGSLFGLHARACGGRLPAASDGWSGPAGVYGKAVIFARRKVAVRESSLRAAAPAADLPRPGERIGRGRPICTIFAKEPDAAACVRELAGRARSLYADLEAGAARVGAA